MSLIIGEVNIKPSPSGQVDRSLQLYSNYPENHHDCHVYKTIEIKVTSQAVNLIKPVGDRQLTTLTTETRLVA